uniref:protein-tyrosine-phosphatase n=1 Tax=Canis lupus familiaris TaxID=9615 RepID=A0A8C0RA31_CANLF
QGRPTSLFLSWAAPGPDKFSRALGLTHLRLSRGVARDQGAQEGNFSEDHAGTATRLEAPGGPGVRPLWSRRAASPHLCATPAAVRDLQLRSPGSPSSLEASWAAAPGEQGACCLLLYHLESQTLVRNISVPRGSLSYTFSDLRPGSEYVLEATTWAGDPQAKSSVRQWTAPVSPPQLLLRALGTGALHASWNHSAGAAGLLLVLTDLLGGTNLTAVVGRGVSSHTFLHLSPGTPHELTLCAVAGPWRAVGPHATEWTYPSAPLDLVLLPRPAALWASWRAGPGARDGYLLRLSGPAERNTTRGPGALRATFPGPLPPGHYTLELGALAGPYDAWARASAWLPGESGLREWEGAPARLPLDGLAAPAEPSRQALLYTEGAPGLPGNISVPPATALGTSGGPVPGAHSWVDIASSLRNTTRNLTDHMKPPAPRSLEVTGRGSPSDLAIGWAPAPGPREGYRVAWHQEGSQRPLGGLVDVGPESSGLTLRDLLPGSCYTVSVWTWAGSLCSSTQRTRACTLPAPPANLSLRLATWPPTLTASWRGPPGGRDGFRLRLYRLGPLTLESRDTLGPEAQNFSWARLPPGAEVLVQLVTVRGPDESSSANAMGWTPPRAPPLVHVTTEGPTELQASWVPAPGARDGYQVTLYLGGGLAGSRTLVAGVGGTSFSALTPGTRYDVEVVARAGPLLLAATTASGWTSPLLPNELLVSMQAGSAVITLAWASGPLGHGACHAQLSEAGRLPWAQPLVLGQARLVLRDLTPGRNLSLSVLCQAGLLRAATHPVVLPVEPGPVEDVQCQPEATGMQLAVGGRAHLVFQASTSGDALLLPSLLPATSYRLGLTVLGRNGLRSRGVTLLCTTSAEGWHPPDLAAAPQLEPEAGMGVLITRGMFGKDDGQIQWYGIIATTNLGSATPEALNHTWHDHYYGGRDSYLATLLPNPFYPGPWAVPRSWMVPVGTEDCGRTRGICNGQLKPGSWYRGQRLRVEGCGRRPPFASIEPRAGVSRVAVPLPAAVGLLAGCCLGATALGLLCRALSPSSGRAVPRGPSAPPDPPPPSPARRTHRPIPIQSFRQSYEAKSAHAHQAFFQEFEELKEVGKEQPRLEAEHPANATKNRYPHVLPYDHSQVRLSQLEGEPHSDYINASFIPGYTDPQEFIATQGPLRKTMEDFWRLVWEQQVHVIVMLTVGMENRVLCEHYWPVGSTPVTHGHITVHLLAEEPEDEWTKREFQLQHRAQRQPRTVTQPQFTTWPDHGVPEPPAPCSPSSSWPGSRRGHAGPRPGARALQVGRGGPVAAAPAAAGGARGGLFHAVYAPRPLLIQTPSQYVCLHRCLLTKALEGPPDRGGPIAPPAARAPGSQPIAVSRWAEACARRAAHANAGFLREYGVRAGRGGAGRASPPRVPSGDRSHLRFSAAKESLTSKMLEAWLFPGGPSGHDHIVVTGPAGPEELWELVWEHGAHVLVSLCPPDTWEQQSWPTETQPIVTETVTVQWVAESVTAGWPCTLLRVTHGESRKERQVQRLLFPCWEPGRELPATTLLPFLAAVGQCCSRDRTKPGTLLSHCSRGVAQLGTFLALDQLLQQAGVECTVDVFSVALQQSQACGLMTPTLEQYMDLYHCLNSALLDGLP